MYIPWPVCNKKIIVEVAHAVYACVYELNTYDIILVYCSISAAVATHFLTVLANCIYVWKFGPINEK